MLLKFVNFSVNTELDLTLVKNKAKNLISHKKLIMNIYRLKNKHHFSNQSL